MSRDDPAHRDALLTSREQEALALLRLGLTNREIADRLGISVAGVRYHVSEIIGKLGVRDRYEAATWPERRPWWSLALAPMALFWRRARAALPVQPSSLATALSAGLFVAALGSLSLMAFMLLNDEGEAGASLVESETRTRISDPPAMSPPGGSGGTPETETRIAVTDPAVPTAASGGPGAMAVDCDASTARVQSSCTYQPGATFSIQIHVTQAPEDGYFGFQTKLRWEAAIAGYLPSDDPAEEAFWPECDLPSRRDNQQQGDPSLLFGCASLPALSEGATNTGAVLQFRLQCQQDGSTPLVLVARQGDRQGGTSFLNRSLTPIDPVLSGAQVACGSPPPCPPGGCSPPAPTSTSPPSNTPLPAPTPRSTATPQPIPPPPPSTPTPELTHVVAISAGGQHVCSLTTSGGVQCWGRDHVGQLGKGTPGDSVTPVDVVGLENGAVAIAAGAGHTCAITREGGVQCWGSNVDGRLGNGMSGLDDEGEGIFSSTPVDVVGLERAVRAIAPGFSHSCAVTAEGGVKCWGSNRLGELGQPVTQRCIIGPDAYESLCSPTPIDVLDQEGEPVTGVVAITAGGGHTCALTTVGGVKCWGASGYGQLGTGTNSSPSGSVDVYGLTSGVAAVDAGSAHTCALTETGGVKCWGFNSNGQLGNGDVGFHPVRIPQDVLGLETGVAAIASGGLHTCALLVTGGVKCWGFNFFGQVGDGTAGIGTDRLTPVDVLGLSSGVVAVSAGDFHTCALTDTGAVTCWGAADPADFGQTGESDGDR